MSELTLSPKRHRRQNNMLRQSRMPLEKGKCIGPYEIVEFLKEGSSSKIYLAKSQYTNENVVIKAISKSHFQKNLDDLLLITRQIETLKILKHRNIVTLYEIYESRKHIYLITEYCQGKDLIEKIIRKKRFSEEEALVIFFQLLDAFTDMHKMNICHRNVRTEHILFDKNNRPKIVGFGYSSFYEKNKKIEGAFGSLCYACPEIIDEQPYNPELADVWSLGVILYVLICGYLPFSDEDDNKNKILISEGKIEFPKEISNKLKDLLRHMLDKDPSKRYNFSKIVKHPWIKPYSEIFFSRGVNVYKTKFPVDEKILNIIQEFKFDKNKIRNDLLQNKFNNGTGLYKQIVRKLIDMKIKNISDLFCEEFNEYRDNKKNIYDNGDKKYDEYIKKVSEKIKKTEEFVNEFKEREDRIVEKLMAIKEQKEEEKSKLNVIDEENDKDKEEDNINDTKEDNNKDNDIMNNDNNNIEIVYNDEQDQDIDIIQQFNEEQNKKLSSNNLIIDQSSSNNKVKKDIKPNKNVSIEDKSLGQTNEKETTKKNNIYLPKSKTVKKPAYKNYFKSSSNPNIITPSSFSPNSNFRMTGMKKNNTKNYFDRGSLYDDFLKKNHPANIRKSMFKFSNLYENIENIKEKNESESEKEEKGKKEEKVEKKEDKSKLKYSLSFDFDDEDEEENKENDDGEDDVIIDIIDGEGDEKLFNLLNNDDDEEMKELKKLYYGDNLKESVRFIKKSILKKKSVKFKDDVDKKEKEKKVELNRVGTSSSGLDIDKYEAKLKEYNKNLQIYNDKEDCNNNNENEKMKFDISFHYDNNNDKNDIKKNKNSSNEDIISYNNDKNYIKKMKLEKSCNMYDIKNINNLLKKNYMTKFEKALPSNNIKIIEDNNDIKSINEFFLKKCKEKPELFVNLKTNKTNDQNKKDESTQINFFKNFKSNKNIKFKITRNFFSINPNENKNNILENDRYGYEYNGNNQVNINKNKKIPIRLNYNRNNQINQNRQKEFNKKTKLQKYFKKHKTNLNINTDNINLKSDNHTYRPEKSPNFRTYYNQKFDFSDLSNNLTSESQIIYRNNPDYRSYVKNTYNNDESEIYSNYSKTMPKSAFSSVKNIKNEVIVKRNEIIEKIQHCQNLLNTIMIDKKNIMTNKKSNFNNKNEISQNLLTYNKKSFGISDFDMNVNLKKNSVIKNNNGVNPVYKKNNININSNNPNTINKYTYKRINIRYLDKQNDIYSFDNMSRDNTNNSIPNTENNYNYTNNYYTKQFPNKSLKNYLEPDENLNNLSFDFPNKQINKRYELNNKYNYSSFMPINKKKLLENQINNNTYNNNDIAMKNIYKTNNININNKNPLSKKLKGY